MKIEKIIYQTTRNVLNVEDKLKIASIFLFCEKLGSKKLSELLYSKNHQKFIENLNKEYKNYDIDLLINFLNPNVKNAFYLTLEEVIKTYDKDGFLKAISNNDEFSIAILDIINYNFSSLELINIKNQINEQLKLF
jgi:hypothetical protein